MQAREGLDWVAFDISKRDCALEGESPSGEERKRTRAAQGGLP